MVFKTVKLLFSAKLKVPKASKVKGHCFWPLGLRPLHFDCSLGVGLGPGKLSQFNHDDPASQVAFVLRRLSEDFVWLTPSPIDAVAFEQPPHNWAAAAVSGSDGSA
jgi:hypothetical protein